MRWCRHASDAELRWCYDHAAMLCYPSREEGFGLPIVEALVQGLPVVAGTDPTLVEAAQGHALHLDPDDRAAWRDAVIATTRRGRPAEPPALVLRSWAEHVDQTVAVYREAVAARGR